ncbi:uncharacterized protein PHALS_04155 [Plasmopara halstedii]|uniref:Uncharacterized protein n=1 Tax=Plasmopara halstedii TaxID=4781 RepID=A0A0P1A888_PLAHL|nr:uncharacterized protein PHALS_04155 [Plasmopara halstedii]CEG36904.1 hypothetical protein PHALS_04155 [Plasmopara halstedii]|eukprot:XP_024573273.1 hypothetical protein PHALS_04155 [Plasmopara halstedii]
MVQGFAYEQPKEEELSLVRRMVLQSDNATCNHNTLLPSIPPSWVLSKEVLKSWVKESNNCVIPTPAVEGLSSHYWVLNYNVELVHNRERLFGLAKQVESMDRQLKRTVEMSADSARIRRDLRQLEIRCTAVARPSLPRLTSTQVVEEGSLGEYSDVKERMKKRLYAWKNKVAESLKITTRRRRHQPRPLPEQQAALVDSRDIVSYAIRKTLQLQSTGENAVTDEGHDVQCNQRVLSDIDEGVQIPFELLSE